MEFRPGRSAGDGSLPDWKTGFERSSPIWSGTATATDGTRSIGRSAHKNRSSPDSSTTSGSNGSTSPTTSAASRSDTVHTPMAGSTGWCFRTRRVMARGRSSTSQRSGSRGRSTWTRERSKTLWTRRSSADSRATIRTRRGNRGSRPRGCATTANGPARAAVATNTNHTTEIEHDEIDASLLCLRGADDAGQPVEDGERLVEDIGGELVALDDARHWVDGGPTRAYLERIERFLAAE